MFTLGYRPWLDGLRGIAIITVFGFHLSALQSVIRGTGAAGLDVFFVLSGFLITLLLLEERRTDGAISLRGFYLRRVRRLLPALALFLVAYVALALTGLPEFERGNPLSNVVPAAFYYGNWVKALTDNQLGLLGHTWSLSVEEQFYLVWPFALIALGSRGIVGRRLLAVILGGTVASMVWYEVLRHGDALQQRRSYFGTDTRGFALLLGCAAAVVLHYGLQPTAAWWPRVRAAFGSAAGAYLAVFFFKPSLLPIDRNYPLELTAVATALIIVHLAETPTNWFHAALSFSPLVWAGRLSYGVYLFHFPVIELLTPERTGLDGGALALFDIVVTLALALTSWMLIERRFLERRYASRPMATAAAL